MYMYIICTCILYVHVYYMYMYIICTCILYVHVFYMYMYIICTCILVHVCYMYMYVICTCILYVHVCYMCMYIFLLHSKFVVLIYGTWRLRYLLLLLEFSLYVPAHIVLNYFGQPFPLVSKNIFLINCVSD